MLRGAVALFTVTMTLALWPTAASAQILRRPPAAIDGPPFDKGGCYFYRGREWCGRNCYYEVNGKRYCQRWERDAVPQAPLLILPEDLGLK